VSRDIDHSVALSEQAARWWVAFHTEGTMPSEHREFEEWLRRGPDRVAAYLRVARFHRALKNPQLRWPDTPVAELARVAKSSSADTAPLRPTPSGSERRLHSIRRPGLSVAWALSVLFVVVLGSTWLALTGADEYSTRIGEQRSIVLEDGSRITLNTDSRIEARLRKGDRRVRVLRGEALFEVSHDATRPFDVEAGRAVFRAVGTQFDVDRRPRQTVMTVLEGRVVLLVKEDLTERRDAFPALEPADQVVIGPDGAPVALEHAVDVRAAVAWTRHQIVFENRPAGEIAAEFNRYNRDRIEIRSEALRRQEVTGVFRSNRPASFVDFLKSRPGVRVRTDAKGHHIVSLDEDAAMEK
jgi:transmembrane sensor